MAPEGTVPEAPDDPTRLAREAGPYVLSEPELQARLAEQEAEGTLRCALCGQPLAAHEATFLRRRLAHRWATLAVHPACGAEAGGDAPAAPAPAPRAVPEALPAWTARLGRLAGRVEVAAAVVTCHDPEAAAHLPGDLSMGPDLEDFDPVWGAVARAVHAAWADVRLRWAPDLRVRVPRAGGADVAVTVAGRTLRAQAAEEGRDLFLRLAAAGPCVVVVEEAPARPWAAFLGPRQDAEPA